MHQNHFLYIMLEKNYDYYLQRIRIAEQQEDAQIKAELDKYIPTLPYHTDEELKNMLKDFRVPLRAYLKLRMLKGSPKSPQHLVLIFCLAKIASQIYSRHVPETGKRLCGDISCTTWEYIFNPLHDDSYDYHVDMREKEKSLGEQNTRKSYWLYYEIDNAMEELPPCSDLLRRYLNHVCRDILHLYALDWDCLQSNFCRNLSLKRVNTDEEDYLPLRDRMKLLRYTNFILPEEIPNEEIFYFFRDHNLE